MSQKKVSIVSLSLVSYWPSAHISCSLFASVLLFSQPILWGRQWCVCWVSYIVWVLRYLCRKIILRSKLQRHCRRCCGIIACPRLPNKDSGSIWSSDANTKYQVGCVVLCTHRASTGTLFSTQTRHDSYFCQMGGGSRDGDPCLSWSRLLWRFQ